MALTVSAGRSLADKIRAWLRNSGQGAPVGELAQFVNDIEHARNVSTWAGVDFERILPFRIPISRRVQTMSIIRNAIIFGPIVLTWTSLERAAADFAKYDDGRNFLQLWYERDSWLSLQWVALLDAAMIGLVVVLTVAVGLMEEGDARSTRLEQEHAGLMVALERDLSGYRYLSIEDINSAASGTLQSLLGSSQEIEKAATSFASTAADAHAAISGAQDAVVRVFEPAVERLDKVITSLGRAASTHEEMVSVVEGAQESLRRQFDAVQGIATTTLATIGTNADRILRDLESRLAGASQLLGSALSQGLTDLNAGVRDAATNASTQSAQHVAGLASEVRAAASAMDGAAANVRAVLDQLGNVTNLVMVNTATMADDLEKIHEKLKAILK